MQQLLWAEVVVKGTVGLALLLVPLVLLTLAGIQKPESGFWPRVAGAFTSGIAASVWIGMQYPDARGSVGPAALVVINLVVAALLVVALVLGIAGPTRRGKLSLAAIAAGLGAFAFLEIAHT